MPFSEFIRFGKRKVDATLLQRTSNLPSELSFQGGNDCCELVWGNGQVITRNQSSKERKVSSSNNMPSIITKSQDGNEAMNSKSKYSSFDSVLNDFPLSAPQCEMSLDEDDDAVPWLSCPVVSEEPFNNVYCSEILPESFGVTPNEFAHSNSTAKLSKLGNHETSSFAQAQNIIPRSSGSSELDCSEIKDSTGTMNLQKNNSGQMNNTAALMNFSYFSRFAVQSGATVKNTATSNGVDVNGVQTTSNQNKGKVVSTHNQMESTFVNSSAGLPPKSDSALPEHSVVRCKESDGNGLEPAVATSSVCSGNSLERDSNNPPNSLKRKCFEDSEGPSEEAEYESVGIQKNAANRSGSKRSRAAEVHNQSERRRRERINEKMRALQELIPNCNKVDKASMLDEAIEYLKTLQLQVQILSMGTGMYMSQMMLPIAMQHMQRTHMSQFPPMGIGMGPALGFGMSLSDVNSMMQMPSLQNPCFPISSPPTSSPSGFYGGVNSIPMRLPVGNVPGMPLANNSMNQDPNQGSNANEAQIANGLCNIKHSC